MKADDATMRTEWSALASTSCRVSVKSAVIGVLARGEMAARWQRDGGVEGRSIT